MAHQHAVRVNLPLLVLGPSCEELFKDLCDAWKENTLSDCNIPLSAISKEAERFNTWARNRAAFQGPNLLSSLQYRLRNNQKTLERVTEILLYLKESLELGE